MEGLPYSYGGGFGRVLEEDGVEMNDEDDLESAIGIGMGLPLPPSVLQERERRELEEGDGTDGEEGEDDPPDFVSTLPSTRTGTKADSSRTNRARRRRKSHPTGSGGGGTIRLGSGSTGGGRGPVGGILGGMGAKERALWMWVNVEDLDGFLQEVYVYYVGKGIYAIGLSRLLNLLFVPHPFFPLAHRGEVGLLTERGGIGLSDG